VANPWRGEGERSVLVQLALAVSGRLHWLLRLLGVEPHAFDDLLAVRVTLDLRGARPAGRSNVMSVLALALVVGFGLGAAAEHIDDPFLWALLELSVASLVLGMVLLLHLGNILLDGTDLHVVGPLPVPERTLYAARIGHALVYVSVLAFCLHACPAAFAGLVYAPWAALALVPAAVLATVLVVAAVALFHALLLTACGPEHFKRVTLWTQVLLGALAMGGSQLLNHLIDFAALAERVEQRPELLGLLPTAWSAGLFALLTGDATPENAALAGLALLAPLLLLFLAVRLGARHFIAGLTFQGGGGEQRRPFALSVFQRLGAHLARDRTERAGYDWTLALSRREPAFLRTAYVQVAGLLLMGISWTFFSFDGSGRASPHFSSFALYLFPLLVPTVLDVSCFTEHPQAARMLRALPIGEPESFHVGALKGLFAGMLLPLFALLFLAGGIAGGARGLPDLCLASASALWLGAGVARRMRLHLPFTVKMRYGATTAVNLVPVLAVLGLTLLAALGHALAQRVPFLPLACAPVVAWLAWREYRGLQGGGRRVRFENDPLLGEGE
jgi:hypothetical protein